MAERSPHASVALLSDSPLRDASRDYFGFAVYAEAVASLIDNELTDTPLTIALSAPWGGGKTSVARMVRRRLAERTASRGHDRPVVACWFDAWMHSDAEHLGAALASAVARTVDEARPRWRRLLSPLPSAMVPPQRRWWRRVAMAFAALVIAALVVAIPQLNAAVQGLIGEKPEERAGQLLGAVLLLFLVARSIFRVADDAARFVDDPRSEAARGSMAQVKQQLGRLIEQGVRGGTLVIYVDDLERCAPDRALEVCEVASQLLAHEHVVTLLVADMAAIAAAAEARYPQAGGDAGRRFLEKIVQIQVALPAPHRDHMQRLVTGEPPADVFARGFASAPAVAAEHDAEPQSLGMGLITFAVGKPQTFLDALTPALVPLGLVAIAAEAGAPVAAFLIAAPLAGFAAARVLVVVNARRARNEAEAIRERIRAAVDDQLPWKEVERRALADLDPRYEALALDLLENQRLDDSPELRQVVDVLAHYPPQVPRSAKRMLNHARLLTQIARERGVFGGRPELTPEHLGEWIVLAERWPRLASRISERPALMSELEQGERPVLDDLVDASGLGDITDLLSREPRLGEVIARLVHFEPAARADSSDAEVLRLDRRAETGA